MSPAVIRTILLTILVFFWSGAAFAAAGAWVGDDAAKVRIVSTVEATGDAGEVMLGLEVKLGPGWHTYWRSPGMAGLPPALDWDKTRAEEFNLSDATILYPAPERYSAFGLETIGYYEQVLFPLRVKLLKPGQPLHLDLGMDYLVCNSICVPKHAALFFDLPAGEAARAPEAALIEAAMDKMPGDARKSGILLRDVRVEDKRLIVRISSRTPLVRPDLFVENDKNIGFGAPVVEVEPGNLNASLTITAVDTLPSPNALSGLPLTLTIVDGPAATEIRATTPASLSSALTTREPEKLPFAMAVMLALLGGLILNLMPCVLPVLSLKILSVVGHGGGTAGAVRRSFVTTAAGIVFSFLALASVMIGLKTFGLALGWGVQFQQPVFLMLLVLLLTFFAANLWGFFEIPLPRLLADRLNGHYKTKLAGDFATGAFATLLATPCSAPFLGTAVGFALAAGPKEIFAVHLALGTGMALPYLLVALIPQIATALPKPGAWMIKLRGILGFALALTAVWLLWVLAAQISVNYALLFGALMLGVLILLSLRKHGVKRGLILLGVAEFCLVGLFFVIDGMTTHAPSPAYDRKWIAYSQASLNADIAEGKTVFLDVTADWCLTCKANMKFTLSDATVEHRLFATDIIAMQADWTNPDPEVIRLLHRYGRYGIPFNIVYGPKAPDGILLPELLSPQMVLDALDRASGDAN